MFQPSTIKLDRFFVTQLPDSFIISDISKCDDYIDAINNDIDGISSFDFTSIYNDIQDFLPSPNSNYTIKFYKNSTDFNAEKDIDGSSLAISDITNYRTSLPKPTNNLG